MNSTSNTLPINARHGVASASHTTENISAWAAKVGWSVWYGLQSYGARRALREMRLMGIGIDQSFASPTNVKNIVGKPGTHR